jgi:hypothetical protein
MSFYRVKILIEEEYIVETKPVADSPEVAEHLAGSPYFSTIVSRTEIKKKTNLIKNPLDHSKEKRTPRNKDFGDFMTMKEFKRHVDVGGITDYDGTGRYADKDYEYHDILTVDQLDERYTHVMWYNR